MHDRQKMARIALANKIARTPWAIRRTERFTRSLCPLPSIAGQKIPATGSRPHMAEGVEESPNGPLGGYFS